MTHPDTPIRPLYKRGHILLAAFAAGCLFILAMTLLLGKSRAGGIFLDTRTTLFVYPFTIQNMEHLLFFLGLGEIFVRWHTAMREQAFLGRHYLPEDDSVVLLSRDLGPIRRSVRSDYDNENGFLPYLIDFCILQFQASRSVDQTVSVLNSSLELISHRVDLRYSMLRYITWAIPTEKCFELLRHIEEIPCCDISPGPFPPPGLSVPSSAFQTPSTGLIRPNRISKPSPPPWVWPLIPPWWPCA